MDYKKRGAWGGGGQGCPFVVCGYSGSIPNLFIFFVGEQPYMIRNHGIPVLVQKQCYFRVTGPLKVGGVIQHGSDE